jgi:hypothetical protein
MTEGGLKNIWKRIELWLVAFLFFILADELVKEGYLFKIVDLFTLEFTHEKLFVAVLVALVGYEVWKASKKHLTI